MLPATTTTATTTQPITAATATSAATTAFTPMTASVAFFFFLAAFALVLTLQQRLLAQANLVAFDADALDQDLLAFGQFVAHVVYAVGRDLADVQQAFGAGEDFDKRAEVHNARDRAQV